MSTSPLGSSALLLAAARPKPNFVSAVRMAGWYSLTLAMSDFVSAHKEPIF